MTELMTNLGFTQVLSLMDFLGYIDWSAFMQFNDLTSDVKGALDKVAKFLLAVGIIFGAIGYMMAGYNFIWGGAQGSQTGKTYFLNTTIGVILILAASAIVSFVENTFSF